MKIINLWGAPSGGKSTTMSGLNYLMKINKHRVETAPEFVKDMIYEKSSMINDSMVIVGEQVRRQNRYLNNVDYIITDCPLPLINLYAPENYYSHFAPLLWEVFEKQENINFLMIRDGEFEVEGRVHDEEESNSKAREIEKILIKRNIPYTPIIARPKAPIEIYSKIFPDMAKDLMLGFV